MPRPSIVFAKEWVMNDGSGHELKSTTVLSATENRTVLKRLD